MRRILILILIPVFLCSFVPVVCSASDTGYPELDPEVVAAFGLSGLQWIDEPESNDDYWNNFLLSFAAGDWEYWDEPLIWNGEIAPVWNKPGGNMIPVFNSLLGALLNQGISVFYANGKYYVATNGVEPLYSKEELMAQQNDVLLAAKAIHDDFWRTGKLREDMTEMERFQVYFHYLTALSIPPSATDYQSEDPQYRTVFMKYDSAYGALINHVADCGGKSAIMNLFAHLEGIQAFGLLGSIVGITDAGHVVNFLRLDGDLYVSDFGSANRGTYLLNSSSLAKWFELDRNVLNTALKYMRCHPDESPASAFQVTDIRSGADYVNISCRVLKGNNGTEDQLFGIRYGEPDNCLYTGGYTLEALEKGINARFSRQEIELNHIPESITLLEE